ncbi:MAG TPA: class I SAM-dependent methyltransferase [Kribbella sp.]
MAAHTHTHPGNRPHLFEGRNTRLYDFVARRVVRGLYRRIADDIADLVPDNGHVLDVGTGPGVLLVEIARLRPDLRITGLDLSADMIAAARTNLRQFGDRADVHVGDVTRLPFEDDSFDLVVTSLSAHHWDKPRAAVPEIARVLRPGGRFSVYDFSFAPYDELDAAARDASVFTGQAVRHQRIRTGLPFFPACYRHVLAA